jgi:hypothetical protein
MKEKFNDVLDENEEIVAVLKPNARKFWWNFGTILFLIIFWVAAFIALILFFKSKEGDITDVRTVWLAIGITTAVFLFVVSVAVFLASLAYRKRYYAFSNKRILIRGGVIGVDFKVLEYKLLGAMTVSVNVVDKILGGKTGSIRFGSASTPIVSGAETNPFSFTHVEKPYELLREIKKAIGKEEK